MSRAARGAACAALALLAVGCMRGGGRGDRIAYLSPPAVDSTTVGLWRMDEVVGSAVADAGARRLHGTAGLDARPEFGRFGYARLFTNAINSFVYVPYDPALDRAHVRIAAWIRPTAYGIYEDTPIAGRWTEELALQSWLFSLVGRGSPTRPLALPGPRYHWSMVGIASEGQLMFAYRTPDAGEPQVFFSSVPIALARWTHVAVTVDPTTVRFWIDGRLDAQHVARGRIRASEAPLMVGNYLDFRRLTSFGGDLRMEGLVDATPYYAFQGSIDELHLEGLAVGDSVPRAR